MEEINDFCSLQHVRLPGGVRTRGFEIWWRGRFGSGQWIVHFTRAAEALDFITQVEVGEPRIVGHATFASYASAMHAGQLWRWRRRRLGGIDQLGPNLRGGWRLTLASGLVVQIPPTLSRDDLAS